MGLGQTRQTSKRQAFSDQQVFDIVEALHAHGVLRWRKMTNRIRKGMHVPGGRVDGGGRGRGRGERRNEFFTFFGWFEVEVQKTSNTP